ncbi:probable Acyltransferase invovled in MEL production [Ustilago trichophora]|uniref:Probable Acyltransferase invovled in MEL production n=1 Tax=Ustilago trichophora TaxID=86804 RepID=A0A5C3EJ93_9BASI|nr:probable Acyltransferase invovled in MEL production [Ustilago trichophora]
MQEGRAWKQVSPNLARRPLIGVEKILNYAEYYQDGNFQVSFAMIFETNLAPETLRQRFGLALWNVRSSLPEIDTWTIATSDTSSIDLDHTTFQAIQTVDEAQKWIDETAILVEDGTTVQEVIDYTSNHRIEPAGKQFQALLVTNPREGSPALVLNASHVLNGHRMLFQGSAILEALVDGRLAALIKSKPDQRAALEVVFAPDDLSRLMHKLPISLNTAYNSRFNPGPSDLEAGLEKLGERLINGTKPTIGIPRYLTPTKEVEHSLGTANGQPMTMLNLRRQLGAVEHRMLHLALKRRASTLPSFVYACIVNSIDRRCRADTVDHGELPGANLIYSAHASRWLAPETLMNDAPVNMAIVPGSAYLSAEELRSRERGSDLNEEELFALAKVIRSMQETYLDSPHMISSMEQVADDVSVMISETASKQRKAGLDPKLALCENSPAICPPTLTSQGDFRIKRLYTAQGASFEPKPQRAEAEYSYLTECIEGGRTTDASVCFAMWSFDGILTLQAHFDSRFFDANLINTILDDVTCQLGRSARSPFDHSSEAKL